MKLDHIHSWPGDHVPSHRAVGHRCLVVLRTGLQICRGQWAQNSGVFVSKAQHPGSSMSEPHICLKLKLKLRSPLTNFCRQAAMGVLS